MKKAMAVTVASLFLAPIILFGAGVVTVKKTENTAQKRVVFDHGIHKKNGVSQCRTCHHKGRIGQSCADSGCHVGPAGTKSMHDRCQGCHRTKGGKAPLQCNGCHVK